MNKKLEPNDVVVDCTPDVDLRICHIQQHSRSLQILVHPKLLFFAILTITVVIGFIMPTVAFTGCYDDKLKVILQKLFTIFCKVLDNVVAQLPDDVVIDILLRLPADRVADCRRVCRRWRSLTSSDYFIKLHLDRSAPLIFVQATDLTDSRGTGKLAFYILYQASNRRNKIKKLRLRPEIKMSQGDTEVVDSCHGLLLFRDAFARWRYYVFNPLTQELLVLDGPNEGASCAFFYDPSANELKILYLCIGFQFFIYSLGGRSWRKIKSPPSGSPPQYDTPLAICNGALHWITSCGRAAEEDIPPCTSGITIFGMDTEDFSTLPHPGDECNSRVNHRNMRLLVVDEHLSFCNVYRGYTVIDIWLLEDYASWAWVRKWCLRPILDGPRPLESECYSFSRRLEVVHFQNGELWLDCGERGLVLYHLDQNTFKKLGRPPTSYQHRCIPYTKSLVPLHRAALPQD
nr:F-box protein At3g07870-like [Coffea arabica]